MHVLAYLRARTHRSPRVDHRPRVDIGADIYVRGHQDGSRGDICAVSGHGLRNDAHAQLLVVVLELHLVVPLQLAAAHGAHLLYGEIHDYGLLDPLVHLPEALLEIYGLGRAQSALVDGLHNLADGTLGGLVGQQRAVVPRPLDYFLVFTVHDISDFVPKIWQISQLSAPRRNIRPAAATATYHLQEYAPK